MQFPVYISTTVISAILEQSNLYAKKLGPRTATRLS